MDPIQSWVDPEEVRRLAEGLISRPAKIDETREEAGYGDGWVGFAGGESGKRPEAPPPATAADESPRAPARTTRSDEEAPVDDRIQKQARQSLEAARRIAETSGLLAPGEPEEPAAVPEPAAATSPEVGAASPAPAPRPAPSPFVERLQRYGLWLHQSFSASGYFVANREGEVLIDEVRSPKLLQVARTLAHASRTANRQAGGVAVGSLHIKLGPDGILEVIPLSSRYGPLVLGLIVPECLSPRGVEAAAAGLQQVVEGTTPNP